VRFGEVPAQVLSQLDEGVADGNNHALEQAGIGEACIVEQADRFNFLTSSISRFTMTSACQL